MSAPQAPPSVAPRHLALVAVAAALALAAGAVLWPAAVAAGWLVALTFWSSGPVGAIVLALIHETTGGRWGLAAAPALRLGCLCSLVLPPMFLVFAPFAGLVYPWAHADALVAPDVSRFFLNARFFAAYGFAATVGWAIIALLLASGRIGLLGASLSLVFHGVAVSIVSVAWLLSIDPAYANSAFGAEIAVQQILFALAAVLAIAPERAVAVAGGDIAALLLATALGAFYLGLMSFIVKWYGDQPHDAAWWLSRAHGIAFILLLGTLVFGAAVPIFACAWERIRTSERALRLIGFSTILGVFLHSLWLANATAVADILASSVATVFMAALSLAVAPGLDRQVGRRWRQARSERREVGR